MKATLWFLALFGVAVAIALFAGNNQGTITLFWPPYRVDLSLNLVLLLLAALVVGVFLGMAVMLPLWLRARRAAKAVSNNASGITASPTSSETTHGI